MRAPALRAALAAERAKVERLRGAMEQVLNGCMDREAVRLLRAALEAER